MGNKSDYIKRENITVLIIVFNETKVEQCDPESLISVSCTEILTTVNSAALLSVCLLTRD